MADWKLIGREFYKKGQYRRATHRTAELRKKGFRAKVVRGYCGYVVYWWKKGEARRRGAEVNG